jgi:elongator complex protein 3
LRLSKDSGYHTINETKREIVFDKLVNCAMIRELHVYGQTTKVKSKDTKSQQHMGYGSKLLIEAFKISKEYGYDRISVIAGEGVKKYYEKFGFVDDEYFMFKDL